MSQGERAIRRLERACAPTRLRCRHFARSSAVFGHHIAAANVTNSGVGVSKPIGRIRTNSGKTVNQILGRRKAAAM